MKNCILFLFIFFAISCNTHSSKEKRISQNEEQVLNKEEKLIQLYTESIVPLFQHYEYLNIPSKIRIDEKDDDLNAGAAMGYIEVSRGLVNLDIEWLQVFVLAHELAHIATLSQAQNFNIQGEIPAGTKTNEYKKAEYLADLIAFHLIKKNRPDDFDLLKSNFNYLRDIFGTGNFTHPSGKERITSLKEYINHPEENIEKAFRKRFLSIINTD